ncbi:MAG: pentapeptide repeat-containing protein [Sandaracinaceae bacterium]
MVAVRVAASILASLAFACGGGSAEGARPEPEVARIPPARVDLFAAPQPGRTYLLVHRQVLRIDDHPPHELRTETRFRVLEVLPDGSRRIRGMLTRDESDQGEAYHRLGSSLVELTLGPTGRIQGDPHPVCGEDLHYRLGRYLRTLFSLRAFALPVAIPGRRWESPLFTDASELPLNATFVLQDWGEDGGSGSVQAPVSLPAGDLGEMRYRGHGRARGHFTVGAEDRFLGETSVTYTLSGTLIEGRERRRARVVLESEARARLAPEPELGDEDFACFGIESLMRALGRREHDLRACYEGALEHHPEMRVRMTLRVTVSPSSAISQVAVPETVVTAGDLAHPEAAPEDAATRADGTRADATRADLTRADVTGADVTGADLTRADAPSVSALERRRHLHDMTNCMMAVMRELEVPVGPVGGPAVVEFPFVFAPERDGQP